MSPLYEFHFRQTQAPYAEVAPATYVLPTDLIVSGAFVDRNGLSFGWTSAPSSSQNNTAAGDARVSGRHAITGSQLFRYFLTRGPNTYRVWHGHGGISSAVTSGFEILDEDGTILFSRPGVSVLKDQLVDINGNPYTPAAFIAAGFGDFIEIKPKGRYITLRKFGTTAWYPSLLAIQSLDDALAPTKILGEGAVDALTKIYTREPAGKIDFTLKADIGLPNFALTGPIATYYDLQFYNGAWKGRRKSTLMPDNVNLSGSAIVQTMDTQTITTPFAPQVVNAPATKPNDTTREGLMTVASYIHWKKVLDTFAAERHFYNGQSFKQDLVANSAASLITAINGITPDGTSWYRIRLQSGGDWGGTVGFSSKAFAANGGGLLIEPDDGHDPLITAFFNYADRMDGVVWRNSKIVPLTSFYSFQGGFGNVGAYPRWSFEDNRIGYYYLPPPYDTTKWQTWNSFLSMEFVRQIRLIRNQIRGLANYIIVSGGRLWEFDSEDFQEVNKDIYGVTTAFRFNTPRGVFADDESYCLVTIPTVRNKLAVYSQVSGAGIPHSDLIQIRRTGGTAYPYSQYPNGNRNSRWTDGTNGTTQLRAFNPAEDRIYKVVGQTTANGAVAGVGGPDAPSGTGTGIVCGGVIFDYEQPYNLATTLNLIFDGVATLANGKQISADGAAQEGQQVLINSNDGWKNLLKVTAIDVLACSTYARGLDAGQESEMRVENCTFANAAKGVLPPDQPLIKAGKVYARRCFVGVNAPNTPNVIGTIWAEAEDCIGVAWKPDIPGVAPADVLSGPFAFDTNMQAFGFPVSDDGSDSQASFRSTLGKNLHSKDGKTGARMREVHTIRITAGAGQEILQQMPVTR